MKIKMCQIMMMITVSLSVIIWGITTEQRTQDFVTTSNRKLVPKDKSNITLKTVLVVNPLMCGHWCLRTPQCLSFNLEKDTRISAERVCELLPLDVEQRPDLLVESEAFDYYSTQV